MKLMQPTNAVATAAIRAQTVMETTTSLSTGTPRLLAVSAPLSMALKFHRFPRKYTRAPAVIHAMRPISFQLARPRSPKVQ